MPKLTKQKPRYPGDLIERHRKMVQKGKVEKHGLAEEKAELALLQKAAKKVKKGGKK